MTRHFYRNSRTAIVFCDEWARFPRAKASAKLKRSVYHSGIQTSTAVLSVIYFTHLISIKTNQWLNLVVLEFQES